MERKESKKEKETSKGTDKEKGKSKYFSYVKHLVLTEKGIDNINLRNCLVFVVDRRSTKKQIKNEIEDIFKVKVKKVNTLIDRKGRKKAYVILDKEFNAVDIATQLGMM